MSGPVVMLVAAEASGDVLGADLARALKAKVPGVTLVGVGGPRMAAEGVESPFDISELSVLGLVEGLMAYGHVKRRVAEVVEFALKQRPKIAILIDSFGFTYRVARALRAADPSIQLVKYVGPQVWASRPGRAKALAGAFDRLLTIVPFDAPFYEPLGFPVDFVGNPALARPFDDADADRARRSLGIGPDEPILLVLPGSRPGEIARMLPPFEDAVERLKTERPELQVVMPVAETVAELVRSRVSGWPHRVHLVEGEQARRDAMKAATVALACSGTVTTELAMAGVPMVVAYRLGRLTYNMMKWLIRTPYVVLFNIAAGRMIAPEMIQGDCTGEKLARELANLLDDPRLRERQRSDQYAALQSLGLGMAAPSRTAAEIIARELATSH